MTDCRCRCMGLDLLPSSATHAGSSAALKPIAQTNGHAANSKEAMGQANDALAHQQGQYHQQISNQSDRQQLQQQSQTPSNSAALQQIHQQYPQGLPLDVLALAQAIQLMNLARGSAGGATAPPAGSPVTTNGPLMVSPDAASAVSATSHKQHGFPSASSSPHMHAAAAAAGAMQMHQSQSSPYLIAAGTSVPSPSHLAHSAQATPHHAHPSHTAAPMQRAGSSVNLGRTVPKATFPLTRW